MLTPSVASAAPFCVCGGLLPDLETVPAAAESVAPPASPVEAAIATGDQAAFKEARRQALQRGALPPLETPAATETPEQEAESAKADTEVSEAARTLRKNRADSRKQQIQNEINDLVKLRNQLRSEVQAPRAPAADPSPAPPVASPPAFPSFDTWAQAHPDQPYEGYIQAAISHGIETRLAAERAAVQQQQTFQTYADRAAAFKAQHPDYDDVIDGVPVTEMMLEVIRESEHAPALAYYLGQHRDEAARLAGLAPAALLKALGALEVRVTQPATPASAPRKLTSSAAAPPTTLGSKAADPGDELSAAVASGDVARFKELRLRQRAAQLSGR